MIRSTACSSISDENGDCGVEDAESRERVRGGGQLLLVSNDDMQCEGVGGLRTRI